MYIIVRKIVEIFSIERHCKLNKQNYFNKKNEIDAWLNNNNTPQIKASH